MQSLEVESQAHQTPFASNFFQAAQSKGSSIPRLDLYRWLSLSKPKTENQHRHKGFNLFSEEDTCLFRSLLQGEFFISGFTNKQLRQSLSDNSASQMTRLLKRLRVHGIIKKVSKRYKYCLTDFGREAAVMALKLCEMVVIPEFASSAQP
jgi:hypothetical protein